MRLQGKPLGEVEWTDLLRLVEEKVPESASLDYKARLPGSNDADKKDLLADASAMANTSGGVILFGVPEARNEDGSKTDLPESIVGVPAAGAAQDTLRIEHVIRSGLDPPLARLLVRPIFSPDRTTYVLAVGVAASLLAPHAVATATTLPFWRRAGAGRFALRTSELRRAFLERGTWELDAEEFRSRRIAVQRSGSGSLASFELSTDPAFLLHVVPLGRQRDWIDLIPHWKLFEEHLTFAKGAYNGRVNFEGVLRTHGFRGQLTKYVQWFRFGGVEAFSANFGGVESVGGPQRRTVRCTTPSILAVEYARNAMLLIDRHLGVPPPYAVMFSMLSVKDRVLEMIRKQQAAFPYEDTYHPITEDDLLFPAVFFEEAPEDVQLVAAALRPSLDAFWQSGGIGRCRLYNPDGAWIGRTIEGWDSLL